MYQIIKNLSNNPSEQEREAVKIYNQAYDVCPGTIAVHGNTVQERAYFKAAMTRLQKAYENEIVHQSADRNVDKELSFYTEINKALGVLQDAPPGLKALAENARQGAAEREKKCSTQDNRTTALGGPRNQGDVGWCYAFTAADLISHRLGKQVSALDIAFKFNATDKGNVANKNRNAFQVGASSKAPTFETTIEGGYVSDAINYMKAQGVCKESDLPSNDSVLTNLKQSLDDIHRLKDKITEGSPVCDYSSYQKSFARFSNLKMPEILQTAIETSHVDLMRTLAGKNCKNKISLDHFKANDIDAKKSLKDAMARLNDTLESGNIAGISYSIKLLRPDSDGFHGSSVVGRKFNKETGECEYLLRNSWGVSKDTKSVYNGNEGYYYIPASSLKKNLLSLTYLTTEIPK